MRLSKETHYALLALVHLAEQREGTIIEAAELAGRIDVSPTFLSKILQRLARAGLVRGHRGRERGYGLARPAAELSVREVTETFEGEGYFQRCIFWSNECSEKEPCPLHGVWGAVRPQMREAFSELTVAALAQGSSRKRGRVPAAAPPRAAARRTE
jgi:Rrf2 family iron-sulfur cluster assembly transcriptional regulator